MTQRNFKDYSLLTARGLAMGVADVIPGVSGGTIAFITGIYEELINSIKSVNRQFFTLLFSKGIAAAWKHINGNFLLAVFSGVLLSIFSLASLITWLLDKHPKMVWAFFFGLIVASALHVGRTITKWNATTIISMLVGTAIAAWITIATPATTPQTMWFILISGSIAITAMILPGISGSFILLLLGKYEFILNAVKDLKIDVILVFAVGCVLGIISFSNIISWFFKKFLNATMALLTGFMLGSLNKLWPWRKITEYYTNSEGISVPLVEKSVTPAQFTEITGEPAQVYSVLAFMVLGFLVIFLFDLFTAAKVKEKNSAI